MARARRKSPSGKARVTASQRAARSRRAKIVWGSLLGSMTMVGGLLLLLDGNPAPRMDGLSLAPLAAASGPSIPEAALQTIQPLAKANWKGIVIHHSGSLLGSAASIQAEHEARNFRGLGHHFIIGNGKGMTNGELHIGYRWQEQLPGAHAGGAQGQFHNLHSISICLVGDGNRRAFTQAQMDSLTQLVSTLCRELSIPADKVVLHSEVAATDDPGHLFPVAEFRARLAAAQ